MKGSLLLGLTLASSLAHAGSGPWVIGQGSTTVYLGGEAQRFDHLASRTPSGDGLERSVSEVGEGVNTLGIKLIGTVGLLPRVEGELGIPWYRVSQSRPGASPCSDLGAGSCATTSGIGVVRMRLKGLLLDEVAGAPFSLSIGPELRLGQHTSDTRDRITNLGEGTLDAGTFLAIGRSGGLADGYWSAWLEGGWRHRTSNTTAGGVEVPGDEWTGDFELFLSPDRRWAVGPTVSAYYRPEGLEFFEADLTDRDRFTSLRVASLTAGAKMLIRSGDDLTLSAGVLRTALSLNNPSDVWTVDLGLSVRNLFQRQGG